MGCCATARYRAADRRNRKKESARASRSKADIRHAADHGRVALADMGEGVPMGRLSEIAKAPPKRGLFH